MDERKMNSILVVDDENTNIVALTQILGPEYTILSANDGQSGIEAAQKHLPDLILLDIVMPQMDGYAVIATLKSSKDTQNIPVIFITGLDGEDDEEKGLKSGAVDYITKPFSMTNVKLRVRNQIEMLIRLRNIEWISMVDQLTELNNRRSFENRIESEWARSLREQTPISILFIDADKFKNYNDAFGHLQGDIALKTLAKVFTNTLKRPGDFVARWGGEEFVVLLPNTDLQGALKVAEQIRKNVEKMKIPCAEAKASKISISIGVNTKSAGESGTIDEFILGADTALYAAKNSGRNKVCHVVESE